MSVSLGLIVTELVINSLKHAFPKGPRDGRITVDYRSSGTGWTLTVADNGVGFPTGEDGGRPGLGTGIVEALATQLDAHVVIRHEKPGTTVLIEYDGPGFSELRTLPRVNQ